MKAIFWWGYTHENGNVIVKRYFSERDLAEAKESPFANTIYGPFVADNTLEAHLRYKDHIRGYEPPIKWVKEDRIKLKFLDEI